MTSKVSTRQTRSNSGVIPSVYSPSRRDEAPQAVQQPGPAIKRSLLPSAQPNNARSLGPDSIVPPWLSSVSTGLPTIREATIEPPTSASRRGVSAAPSINEEPISDAESATAGTSMFKRRGKPVSKLRARLKGTVSAETAPSSPARKRKLVALSGVSTSLAGIAVPRPAGINAINKIRARAPEPERISNTASTPKKKRRRLLTEEPASMEPSSSSITADEGTRGSANGKAIEPVQLIPDMVNQESIRPIKRVPTPSQSKPAEFVVPKLPLISIAEKEPAHVDQSMDADTTLVANEAASPVPVTQKTIMTLPSKAASHRASKSAKKTQAIVVAPARQQSLPLQLQPHKAIFPLASTAGHPSAQTGESAKHAMVQRSTGNAVKQVQHPNTIPDLTGLDKLIAELPQLVSMRTNSIDELADTACQRDSMQSRQMEISAAHGQVEDLQMRISVHRDEVTKLRASKAKYKQKTLELEMVRVAKAKLEGQLERLKMQKVHSEANAATLEAQHREAHARVIET